MNFKNIAVLCLAVVAGCTSTAKLYPANDATMPMGVAEAVFSYDGSGNGTMTATTSDGETFKGDYTVVRDGTMGFGSVFGSVFSNTSGVTNFNGSSSAYSMEGKSAGAAFAMGSKGTRMDCEFVNDNWSGHGYGACKTSTGFLYKLIY